MQHVKVKYSDKPHLKKTAGWWGSRGIGTGFGEIIVGMITMIGDAETWRCD